MDMSQASPTQKNDDRDYENHFDPEPVHTSIRDDSPIPDSQTAQLAADDARSDGGQADTQPGDVCFEPLSFHEPTSESQKTDDIEPSSPVPGPGPGLNIDRNGWRRIRTSSSQHHSSLQRPETQTPLRQTHPVPETPAAANNPFAGNAMFKGEALAASQLFGQTQQSSPFKGGFSPTSSRPSPAMLMQPGTSPNLADSPFRDEFNISPATERPPTRHLRTSEPMGASSSANFRTPAPVRWQHGNVVQDTPSAVITRNNPRKHEPMAHYESMKESQERRKRQRGQSPPGESSGFDTDEEEDAARAKRQRVARIREKAARELASIRKPDRTLRGDIEVPGTTQKDVNAQARRRPPVLDAFEEVDEDEISTVADSQEHVLTAHRLGTLTTVPRSPDQPEKPPVPVVDPDYVSSNERIPDSTACTRTEEAENPPAPSTMHPASSEGRLPDTSPDMDMIPDTSPLVKPVPETEAESIEAPEPSQHNHDSFDRLPEPSRRSGRVAKPSAKAKLVMSGNPSTPKVANSTGEAAAPTTAKKSRRFSDVSVIPESSPQLQPRSTKANLPSSPPARPPVLPTSVTQVAADPRTPAPHSTAPASIGTSSSLSSLSTMTDPSMQSTQEASIGGTPQSRPELPTLRTALDGLKGSRSGNRRSTRIRRGSTSTDELARSSTPVGFENSIIKPAKKITNKSKRAAPRSDVDKLFSGMAFAVSFQSQRPGENDEAFRKRMELGKEIEATIIDSGGRLLTEGFDELFDSDALRTMATSPTGDSEAPSSNSLGLAQDSRALGFTALVADGHSRKVKYMQALALGLPCISDRWITDCLAKRAIIDWAPYLLCAGQSTFLRGTVRSQVLTPYPAKDARLVDVVEQRAQLLAGSKILLVMKKSRQQEDQTMRYVFLLHVLGASLLRAYGMADAQDMMRQRDLLGSPFDLVYIDEKTGTEAALFDKVAVPRRKKASQVQPPRKVRTLKHELVIQSLILGRMIEEDEMEA
jgi:hypothetical protein